MRNVSTIIRKQEFSTSGTYNMLRQVDSYLDFNINTNISTMVMASSELCGMEYIIRTWSSDHIFVGIVSLIFIFFINYHVVDIIECLNLFYMPM
jgi:hypothetical protein